MRDPLGVQSRDHRPDCVESFVGDVVELIGGGSVDGLVRQHHAIDTSTGYAENLGCADTQGRSLQRHQRLVLDGALQRDEGAMVAALAQPQPSIGSKQQIGGSLVAAQGLDEDPFAVCANAVPGRRTAGIHVEVVERCQRKAHRP